MLTQIEGSQAVARTVALCRPDVVERLPHLPPDPHHRGDRVDGGVRRAAHVPLHQRRLRVLGHVHGHRCVGHRRPRLYGDGQSRSAVHDRGGLQRRRARTTHRDDPGQSGRRGSHQHLERPLRRHGGARRRVGPALRRDQPGGRRPPSPGLRPGRAALGPRDGVHGRLHPHPRRRAGRPARPGAGRPAGPAFRTPTTPRLRRSRLHRGHGRPGGLHRGALSGPRASCPTPSGPCPSWRRGRPRCWVVRSPDSSARTGPRVPTWWWWWPWVRCSGRSRTWSTGSASEGVPIGVLGIGCFRPFPVDDVRAALASATSVVVVEKAFSPGSGACWRPTWPSPSAPAPPGSIPWWPASVGDRSAAPRSAHCSRTPGRDTSIRWSSAISGPGSSTPSGARMAADRRSGPPAENVLRDVAASAGTRS